MTIPAFPIPTMPRLPSAGDFLPSLPEFPVGLPDLGFDRATEGMRGVEDAVRVVSSGYYWVRDSYRVYKKLTTNGSAFVAGVGAGFIFGAESKDAQGAVIPASGVIPASTTSLGRRFARFSYPWYLGYWSFYEGLWKGLYDEVAGFPELAYSLYDGSLIAALEAALDTIAGSPKDAYGLGQQIGAASFQDVLRAADRADDDRFAYEVGVILGAWIPDLIVAIMTWGAGSIPKMGLKISMWSEETLLLAGKLARRFQRGVRELIPPHLHLPDHALATVGDIGRMPDVPTPSTKTITKSVAHVDATPPSPTVHGTGRSARGVGNDMDRGLATRPSPEPSAPDAPSPAAPSLDGPSTLTTAGRAAAVPATATSAAAGVGSRKAADIRAASVIDIATADITRRLRAPEAPSVSRLDAALGWAKDKRQWLPPEYGGLIAHLKEGYALPKRHRHLARQIVAAGETRGTGGIQRVSATILDSVDFEVSRLPRGTPDTSVNAVRTHISGVILPRQLDRDSKGFKPYNASNEWQKRRKAVVDISLNESLTYDDLDALHAWGPGFGDEARGGMGLGPRWVNQQAQSGAMAKEILGVDSLRDARRGGPFEAELLDVRRFDQPGLEGAMLDYAIAMQERGKATGETFVVGLDVTTTTWGDELLGNPLFVAAAERGDKLQPQDFVREVQYNLLTYRRVGDRLERVEGGSMLLEMELSAPPDSPVITVTAKQSAGSLGETISLTKADLLK